MHDSFAESVVNVATETGTSLVILGRPSTPGASAFGSEGEAIASAMAAPVAILVGEANRIREVEVVREAEGGPGGRFDADGLAVDLARRIGGASVELADFEPESCGPCAPDSCACCRRTPGSSWPARRTLPPGPQC